MADSDPTGGSNGLGSLDAVRGGIHVVDGAAALTGDSSVFGPFSASAWVTAAKNRTAWKGGVWMGNRVTGDGWTGTSWASKTWAAATWTGTNWNQRTWVDSSWSGRYWSSSTWEGKTLATAGWG